MRDWFGGPDAATRRQNTSMSMSEEMLMEIRQIDEAFENSQ